MKKLLQIIAFLPSLCFSQLVINELDSDTPGTDVKEFVEIKSTTPNFSLNGYVLVFFNGNDSKSYLAFDLDGITTNVNGIATLGNAAVTPTCNRIFSNNIIQNGPDAVAIYNGNASNFPMGTLAFSSNLITAIAYGNNAPNTTGLMNLLGLTIQQNEGANALTTTQSIQRKSDGTYEAKTPTPGANNDGSGVILNPITILVTPAGNLLEGNSFNINFSTQTPVTSALNFNYTLANGAFTTADYSGSLNVNIPTGATSTIKTILLVDDVLNEGDETMRITAGTLPATFVMNNNNFEVRVNDNDNMVQPWGTPLNPTYNQVASTAPIGYYASLEGKSGLVLKQAIQDIIADPAVVRERTYGDVFDILKDADQNPANSSQVWLMYVEQARSKLDSQTGSSGATGFWNREHIYPQSRGGFTDATSSIPIGFNNWFPTDANDILAGHCDAHHIRAEDSPENSLRSNRNYGVDYNGPLNTQGSWKGDVARAIFYMCIRYNGLNVVNGNPPDNPDGFIGDLTTLLQWNITDLADDFEMNRNNVIYTWQKNRNPFIDYPLLANYVFGNQFGQTWFSTLSNNNFDSNKVSIYPNPAKDNLTIFGVNEEAFFEIYSMSGQLVFKQKFLGETNFNFQLPTGIYISKISSANGILEKKLLIR
jgi:hypothetical protein